jgi:hypothetical protein
MREGKRRKQQKLDLRLGQLSFIETCKAELCLMPGSRINCPLQKPGLADVSAQPTLQHMKLKGSGQVPGALLVLSYMPDNQSEGQNVT